MDIGKIWNQFESDFPDIARPVLNRVKREHVNHEAAMTAAHTRIFEETLEVVYPDWRDVLHSKEFQRWLQAEPGRLEQAHKPGLKPAVRLLNEFDSAMGRGKRLRSGGDEGFADNDAPPQAKQPRGPDPFAGMASLADILPSARGVVH